jgi:hypothetical protein
LREDKKNPRNTKKGRTRKGMCLIVGMYSKNSEGEPALLLMKKKHRIKGTEAYEISEIVMNVYYMQRVITGREEHGEHAKDM